jgi:C1A family cysteine protease
MNKSLLITALLAALSLGVMLIPNKEHKSSKFEEWKQTYGVQYPNDYEDGYRKMIFKQNVQKIEEHNADPSQTYKMGINQFTDLTNDEFIAIYLNPIISQQSETEVVSDFILSEGEPNADIDWVAKGMVTPVKNQGQCGSCWAFSAVGQIESFFLQKGSSTNLAEQQLVDCSGSYGNQGCNGGWPRNAMNYVKDKGITTTAAYPYVAKTQPCKIQGGAYHISSISAATGCTGLQNALASRVISVAVDARNWSGYHSGIFSNCATQLDHAVLLVGSSSTFWKIKNSWGTGWGEAGYIRIAYGNTCGVCNHEGVWAN